MAKKKENIKKEKKRLVRKKNLRKPQKKKEIGMKERITLEKER